MSSRILKRNQRIFEHEVKGGEIQPIPTPSDPRNPKWRWPLNVNNPVKYANYVARLHMLAGFEMKYPKGAFVRFASKNWYLGRERLIRAACLASQLSRHPFSPKFIEKFLDEVPSAQGVTKQIF